MSWRRGSLQELFNTGTEFEWAAYHFTTNDPLEEALQPGYFGYWSHLLRPGDLIFFGCNAWRGHCPGTCRGTPVRRALLMVVEVGRERTVVRLAQDWGGVEDAARTGPAAGGASLPARRSR